MTPLEPRTHQRYRRIKPNAGIARAVGLAAFALAGLDLAVLHALPAPRLHATTGALIPYRPINFLSEYVRTDYGGWMTACFFLLAVGAVAAGVALGRRARAEAWLMAAAGLALALLGFFPTDLADLATDAVTCGQPGRIEPAR